MSTAPDTNARVGQIRKAHASAKPKHTNPSWLNCHNDMTVLFSHIRTLTAENTALKDYLKIEKALTARQYDEATGLRTDRVNLQAENERLKEKLRNPIQIGETTTRPPLVIDDE